MMDEEGRGEAVPLYPLVAHLIDSEILLFLGENAL